MLVDDHAVVRAGFRRLLEQEPDIRVVAETGSGERACLLYEAHSPDVVVLDLSMPDAGGFDLIQRILGREPSAKILVFSVHEDASFAERAIRLGARGYVTKSSAPEVLAAAVGEVAAGEVYLSADVAGSIVVLRLSANDNTVERLDARELEMLRLMVSGRAATDIAATLDMSGAAVTDCHDLIKRKLQLGDDMELVLLALRRHLA